MERKNEEGKLWETWRGHYREHWREQWTEKRRDTWQDKWKQMRAVERNVKRQLQRTNQRKVFQEEARETRRKGNKRRLLPQRSMLDTSLCKYDNKTQTRWRGWGSSVDRDDMCSPSLSWDEPRERDYRKPHRNVLPKRGSKWAILRSGVWRKAWSGPLLAPGLNSLGRPS